jgi:serine/threonine protein kinase
MARGSDYYTAPEITKDLRYASAQSDIYSLGCILHDMVGTEERVPCGEIREGGPFSAILLGCTRKDPSNRFKSAKAVLDAILSVDSNSYPAPTQQSIDFIMMLEAPIPPAKVAWEKLADFLDHDASDEDRRAICNKLGNDRIAELFSASPADANRIAVVFAEWVNSSSFNFDHCDGLANRLDIFIQNGDFESKVSCLMAMLELGTSHNRWYVEHKFLARCNTGMEENLANRLAIQFRITGEAVCQRILHLERSIGVKREALHPALVRALLETCK